MECPVCVALNRQHNRECETEAAATLHQRTRIGLSTGDHSEQDKLANVILGSRKRQAHIASELQGHRETAHTKKAPAVREASA
jgi:metal-responsive CopG/Arc/MetJ family transcriptional regulator